MTCLEVLVSVICSWWAKGCFLLGHKILWMLYLTLVHWMFLTASLHFSSVNNFQKQCVAQLGFFSFPFVLSYRAGCRGAPYQKSFRSIGADRQSSGTHRKISFEPFPKVTHACKAFDRTSCLFCAVAFLNLSFGGRCVNSSLALHCWHLRALQWSTSLSLSCQSQGLKKKKKKR